MAEEVAALVVAAAAVTAAEAVAALLATAEEEPVPATILPWSSTSAMEAKFVVMPNAALNAAKEDQSDAKTRLNKSIWTNHRPVRRFLR